MPIFEYFCAACQHHWELIVSRSAADTPACPQCGQPGRKELSAPAFQFKGGGWYATGYSKTGDKESGKPEAGKSEPKSESASPAKTESAKAESKPAEAKSPDSPKSSPAPVAAKPSTPSGGA
jgi:putative FmdB family regulatory protein